jgi:hypothetical protein
VPIAPGSTPRVLLRADGSVDVLFALASCGGIARWRPPGTAFELVAEPGRCVVELDAKVNEAGVTHVVARELPSQSAAVVVLFDIDAAGNASAPTTIDSPAGGDRGMFPHLALAPDGTAKSAWATLSSASSSDIELAVPLTSPTSLYGAAGGVAIALDASGAASIFFTDDGGSSPELSGLYLDQGGQDRYLASAIAGAVDAVWCGASLDVLHRKGTDVIVDDVASATNASVLPHVDEGVSADRTPGDVAIACDPSSTRAWATYFVDGVVRIKSFDGAQWSAAAADVDAGGPASISVANGTFHLAYTDVNDHVAYATNP